ncbi:hypothetical protein GW891_01055 [bacterium]|nr:hypothetical protein [bacterium]PIQ08108.1 MAG: hypothetical protein COW71_13535 [Ignavibacteriales bacterium CG18_big_fil_WC_8_21_14_2_50_31_20]
MPTTKKLFFIFALLSLISTSIYSQEIGKIFNKIEADELYGPVLESRTITSEKLKSIIIYSTDKVMFRLENNQISILGDTRNLLYSNSKFIVTNQLFHMYSKSKVIELLNIGKSEIVVLENRKEVFSITVGDYTLEMSNPCPPNCD